MISFYRSKNIPRLCGSRMSRAPRAPGNLDGTLSHGWLKLDGSSPTDTSTWAAKKKTPSDVSLDYTG